MPRKKRTSIDLPAAFPSPPKKKAREHHPQGRAVGMAEASNCFHYKSLLQIQISPLSGPMHQKNLSGKFSISGLATSTTVPSLLLRRARQARSVLAGIQASKCQAKWCAELFVLFEVTSYEQVH
eukprot:757758-Hanusia_phi.AAC.5